MCKYLLESLPRERGPAHERGECFGCSECSGYHHRVFDTGYHLDSPTTCVTGRNIDIEHSLEALCLYALGCKSSRHAAPQAIAHRRLSGVWRSCLVSTASLVPTGHKGTVLAVWCEHAMKTDQVSSRSGYQGCQACDKVQWLEDNMGSAGPNGQSTSWATLSIRYSQSIRCAHGLDPAHGASFLGTASSAGRSCASCARGISASMHVVANVAARSQRQAHFRNGWPTDVTAGPPSDRRSSFLRSSAFMPCGYWPLPPHAGRNPILCLLKQSDHPVHRPAVSAG